MLTFFVLVLALTVCSIGIFWRWVRIHSPEAKRARQAPTIDPGIARSAHLQRLAVLGSQAAGAAHEMKGAISVLYCLAEELEVEKVDCEIVDALRDTARSLHGMADDMTGFSRKSLPGSSVSLEEAVERCVRMTKVELRRLDGIECWVDGMPRVAIEPGRLHQILVNLLRNASEAMCDQAGGRVRITAKIHREQVLLLIDDDGPGVSTSAAGCLFEPFETTKEEQDGTGLGLAISRALARDVGGDLTLAPGLLGGACFALTLPIFVEPVALAS